MNTKFALFSILVSLCLMVWVGEAAFIASLSSALQSVSTLTGIDVIQSSGVYTILIIPRSSSTSSSSSSSTSTITSSITTSNSTFIVSTTTITATATSTATIFPSTTTTTIPTSTSTSISTTTATITPTTTVTPSITSSTSTIKSTSSTITASTCPILYTTVSVYPSSYCTTIVMCGPAVSGCPAYNSSFMSQLSSLASSTTSKSSSSNSVSTATGSLTVSSVSTMVSTGTGQTIVTSGAVVIEIESDGSTSTIYQVASALRYRANSTNSASSANGTSKSIFLVLVTSLISTFLLSMVTI